jgi:hypothetical protein
MPGSQKQIEAILKLPAPQRYDHFIKKVVGWRKLWGLFDDGWAMSETSEGEPVFPLWPEREYAQLCATDIWSSYAPCEIELEEFLADLLPTLRQEGIHPGVFFVPDKGSIDIEIDQLEKDLRAELSKYE